LAPHGCAAGPPCRASCGQGTERGVAPGAVAGHQTAQVKSDAEGGRIMGDTSQDTLHRLAVRLDEVEAQHARVVRESMALRQEQIRRAAALAALRGAGGPDARQTADRPYVAQAAIIDGVPDLSALAGAQLAQPDERDRRTCCGGRGAAGTAG